MWLCCLAALWLAQSLSTSQDVATVETTADACACAGKFDGTAEVLSAAEPGDAVLLRFRTALIEKWTVRKAVVAFHVPAGSPAPKQVTVGAAGNKWNEGSVAAPATGAGVTVKTLALQEGWVAVELPASIADQLASGESVSVAMAALAGESLTVHSRRTGQFMPYLLVRGERPLGKRLP